MTVISQDISSLTGADNNTTFQFIGVLRESDSGTGLITQVASPKYTATAGVLTTDDLDPGAAILIIGGTNQFAITIPESDVAVALWPLIQASIPPPPAGYSQPTMSVDVTVLAEDAEPTATIGGTAPHWVLELGLPAGAGSPSPATTSAEGVIQLAGVLAGTAAAPAFSSSAFGTTSSTAAAGNDSRITGAVPNSTQVIAGTGLSGGGALSGNVTVSATFGTAAGTIAQGNDSRITGAAPLASPALTGTPTAPTPSTGNNSTDIATTAYVQSNLASYETTSGAATATAAALATARGLPSYVASSTLGTYDHAQNFYGLVASNSRHLRGGLGKAQAGLAVAHHVFIGDSETSYYVGSIDYAGMWPRIYRGTLATLGVPIGGTGVVPIADFGTGVDPRWSFTGSWTDANLYQVVSSSGATATFTSDIAGTTVDLCYYGTSGGFTVQVDGGSAVTVSPSGGLTVQHYTVTGLTSATHTVKVTTTSATAVYLLSCNVSGTSGLVIHNLAAYGSTASGSGTGAWDDTSSPVYTNVARTGCLPAGITPDVVWIALGVNDIIGLSAAPATIAAALTVIRNQFSGSDAILVAQYEPGGLSAGVWAAYVGALYALADTLGVPLLDLYDRSGGYSVAVGNGLVASDTVHPTAAAQADWGRTAALAIA